ncbi:hypothetical protein HRbin36_01378 [bacterium HR36]|nr:hypothetical protein HRbin36_01378 [bacterium HR36]
MDKCLGAEEVEAKPYEVRALARIDDDIASDVGVVNIDEIIVRSEETWGLGSGNT